MCLILSYTISADRELVGETKFFFFGGGGYTCEMPSPSVPSLSPKVRHKQLTTSLLSSPLVTYNSVLSCCGTFIIKQTSITESLSHPTKQVIMMISNDKNHIIQLILYPRGSKATFSTLEEK